MRSAPIPPQQPIEALYQAVAKIQSGGTDFLPWTEAATGVPVIGSHTLAATPYSIKNGGGSSGVLLIVSLTVIG